MAQYVMIDSLTHGIDKINQSISELSSRISQCEVEIYQLKNQVYGIYTGRFNETKEKIDGLNLDFIDLKNQIAGEISEIRADLDAWIVNPNEKSDLEISKQNIDDEDNPFLKDYWYWNGEFK